MKSFIGTWDQRIWLLLLWSETVPGCCAHYNTGWLCFPVSPGFCSIWSGGTGWTTTRKPSLWNSRSSMLTWICSVWWHSSWNPVVWVCRPSLLALPPAISRQGSLFCLYTIHSCKFNWLLRSMIFFKFFYVYWRFACFCICVRMFDPGTGVANSCDLPCGAGNWTSPRSFFFFF